MFTVDGSKLYTDDACGGGTLSAESTKAWSHGILCNAANR